ncbi:MAG: CcmD family protein [bacterium]
MTPDDAGKVARQLQHLFAGYAVVWLLTIAFLFMLSRRLAQLVKEIEDFKKKP